MKICLFTDTFYPTVGGAEGVLHNLSLHLSHEGHSIHVLAPKAKRYHEPDSFSYHVIRYGNPSSKRFFVRKTLINLTWVYLRYGFDVLHCHAAYPQAYVGVAFKKWFNTPVVVRPHGSDIIPGGRMRKSKRIEKRLINALLRSDALIAQGEYLKNILLDIGIDNEKIHIIHNGTDLGRFTKGSTFYHPQPYILAVGSLIHRKGFDILIRAFKDIKNQEIDLLIAGQGREEFSLRDFCKTYKIENRVHFLGLVRGQDKVNLYRTAKFLVCPSRKEPFSNVIIEAMASGIPVLASDVDGNRELVKHGINGLLFSPENIGELSKQLQQMIENPHMLTKLGVEARKSVAGFDWSDVVPKYLSLYEKVLHNGKR